MRCAEYQSDRHGGLRATDEQSQKGACAGECYLVRRSHQLAKGLCCERVADSRHGQTPAGRAAGENAKAAMGLVLSGIDVILGRRPASALSAIGRCTIRSVDLTASPIARTRSLVITTGYRRRRRWSGSEGAANRVCHRRGPTQNPGNWGKTGKTPLQYWQVDFGT